MSSKGFSIIKFIFDDFSEILAPPFFIEGVRLLNWELLRCDEFFFTFKFEVPFIDS